MRDRMNISAAIQLSLCIPLIVLCAEPSAAADDHTPAKFQKPTLVAALEETHCLAVTSSGQHALISENRDRSISVIDLTDGHVTATFEDKTNGGWVGALSPDSSKLAYWADAEQIIVREIPGGRTLAAIERGDVWPWGVYFSSASDAIAIAGVGRIDVFTLASRAKVSIETNQWRPSSVAFSPDDRMLAACSISGRSRVSLFDRHKNGARRDLIKTATDTGDLITYGPLDHPGYFVSVAFSPDGKRVVGASETIGNASKLTQWDAESGALIRSDRIEGLNFGVCFLEPSGKWVAAVGRQFIEKKWVPALGLIDSESGTVDQVIRPDAEEFYRVGFAMKSEERRLFTTELSKAGHYHTYYWQLDLPDAARE